MTTYADPQPRHIRYSARHQARLDEETRAKLQVLEGVFHRARGAILRYVMGWALGQTKQWTIDPSIPPAVRPVPVLLEPELLRQVQAAAQAQGASVAAWLRHAMRRVTPDDVPPSWRAEETAVRPHESGYDRRTFGLRLDDETSRKPERLTQTFHRPAADVIRQRVLQAHPEDFPQSWPPARGEHYDGDPL